jgi:hypothetical protein
MNMKSAKNALLLRGKTKGYKNALSAFCLSGTPVPGAIFAGFSKIDFSAWNWPSTANLSCFPTSAFRLSSSAIRP